MSKYEVLADTPQWKALRDRIAQMNTMLSAPGFNMVELGKLYEAATKDLLAAVEEHGMSSTRFAAAAKALDLKTPKAKLDRFLSD